MIAETGGTATAMPGFWVLCGDPENLRDPLVVEVPGLGGALAVFSFEEEAWLHLRLGGWEGLLPSRVSRAQMLALLVGRWADLGSHVALDPIPELESGIFLPLTTMSLEGFVRFLVARKNAGRRFVASL